MLNKSVDSFRYVILGCLRCVEQMFESIRMHYFRLFRLSSTNLWIYSDALFWVVWVVLKKFVDLLRCVFLGCWVCVEQIHASIQMRHFGFFGLFGLC